MNYWANPKPTSSFHREVGEVQLPALQPNLDCVFDYDFWPVWCAFLVSRLGLQQPDIQPDLVGVSLVRSSIGQNTHMPRVDTTTEGV